MNSRLALMLDELGAGVSACSLDTCSMARAKNSVAATYGFERATLATAVQINRKMKPNVIASFGSMIVDSP
jgi:hypothetical protein